LRMERRPTTLPRRFISTRRCSSRLTFLPQSNTDKTPDQSSPQQTREIAGSPGCRGATSMLMHLLLLIKSQAGLAAAHAAHERPPLLPSARESSHPPSRGHRRGQRAGRGGERQHQRQRRQRRRRVLVDEVPGLAHVCAGCYPLLKRQAPPPSLAVLQRFGWGKAGRARRKIIRRLRSCLSNITLCCTIAVPAHAVPCHALPAGMR
jgi:hypothetical protein